MSQASLDPSAPPQTPLPKYQGRAADRKALVDMQRTMFSHTQNPKVKPHIQAACARVWRDLQETKRIMDGKPLPGMLRPDLDQRGANKHRRQRLPSMMPLPEVPAPPPYPSITGNDPKESLSQ